jgi:hypothetical protein
MHSVNIMRVVTLLLCDNITPRVEFIQIVKILMCITTIIVHYEERNKWRRPALRRRLDCRIRDGRRHPGEIRPDLCRHNLRWKEGYINVIIYFIQYSSQGANARNIESQNIQINENKHRSLFNSVLSDRKPAVSAN